MPSGLTALEDNMLMARPPVSNMLVVQAYKRQMEQMVTRGYAKPKVGKRTRAPDEGNLFPMTAQEYKGRRLTQDTKSYQSEQAANSLSGGATSMPPIFMETKIMIV